MCGIAGFVNIECTQERAEHLIASMCAVIRHRGPDDQGTWTGDHAAFGMRRLAIIDLIGGQQPIFNEDRSALIIFNGEIYNYHQLQEELQARGHHFRTNTDTEVIMHAYEEYGDDCVTHLRGMFAFAIWDRKRQRLLAARDRFGKKPFNYYWDGTRLIFGSEIKSILAAGIPRNINDVALDEYLLYRYVPTPNTLFKNVMKLPAAHILIYENGSVQTKRYWDLSFEPTCVDNKDTATARTLELLQDAIKVRLMSDVPLGAFLSGGLDSSVVVGLMNQVMPQSVQTFSIGFEEDEYNELPYARQIATHFHTDHHEFCVKSDLVSVLPQLAWAYDEPFGDSSMLPTYYVSKLAREHVTVALSGDGGDEIFGGYEQYQREYHIQRIPAPLRVAFGHASKILPGGVRGKKRLGTWLRHYGMRSIESYMLFPDYARATFYTPAFFARVQQHDPYQRHLSEYQRVEHLDATARMQCVDSRTYLTDDILVKVDKASMLNSLETRAPLLDQHLAEYVASLSPSVRLHHGNMKYLLKRVAADLLPAEILARPKRGFAIPLSRWFSGELNDYARAMLGSTKAQQRGIFDPQFIKKLLDKRAQSQFVNHGSAIWTLLCLELWFQVYMDQPSLTTGPHIPVYTISKG
ncbi:MAG TPA: asparagine synthase (glutamine-hydrolyzing) [Ktedonobacteraceae bacterium]|nr:asparagine synthase (glutamine-hydrolyzing) [Ktedonobacteraceae bacterium]